MSFPGQGFFDYVVVVIRADHGIFLGSPVLGRNPGVGAAETDGPGTGPDALWPHEGRKAADKIAKTSSNVFLMNVKISVFNGIITLIGYICNMRQYIVDAHLHGSGLGP